MITPIVFFNLITQIIHAIRKFTRYVAFNKFGRKRERIEKYKRF